MFMNHRLISSSRISEALFLNKQAIQIEKDLGKFITEVLSFSRPGENVLLYFYQSAIT